MTQNEFPEDSPALGHSSEVDLFLLIDGQAYGLAEIGPDFVTLREPVELPAGQAQVIMIVDGIERRRWTVFLEYGAVPFELDVATADS
ncbi:MAG TPA: hypothetical protein VMR25_23900 [Planctomycetaceae bacterium]|jgi:hypothetical protein|nr:hypothetical protein [Planctomycetaceae bacterium]